MTVGNVNYMEGTFYPIAEGQDFVERIPIDIALGVFSYLGLKDFRSCLLVNKKWHQIADNTSLWRQVFQTTALKGWQNSFGDIGKIPPLSLNIYDILKSPCPFWEGKTVWQTHLLSLVPATVSDEFLTIDKLGELIQDNTKNSSDTTYYDFCTESIKRAHGATRIEKSYWVLMTKIVLPGSGELSYAEQKELVSNYPNYSFPKMIEAGVSILMEYVTSGKMLYPEESYTCCEEQVGDDEPVAIGGFSEDGFGFLSVRCKFEMYGAAAVRRL